MALGLSEANLISAFVESVLYGLFTILYAAAVYVLSKKWRKRVNMLVLVTSTIMYILSTIHLAVSLQRVINAFLNELDTPGGADAYLGEVANKTYVFQVAVYQIQTLIGDAFIAYRLYIVWSKDKRIVIPAILFWCGNLATAIGGQIAINSVSPTASTFASSVINWPVAFYCLTLITNFFCTILIAFRVWRIEKRSSIVFKTRNLSPVATIVIESGAIYSVFLIVLIATYESESWSHYLILDALPQVIGFVFTMIIVRIGLGVAIQEASSSSISTRSVGSVYPIAVQMTSFRTARDDMNQVVDIIPGRRSISSSQKQNLAGVDLVEEN